jgi:hypothetical protein
MFYVFINGSYLNIISVLNTELEKGSEIDDFENRSHAVPGI